MMHIRTKDFFVAGSNYIRTCLKKSLIERYENFMSIDWLPHDEIRRFPDHVYTDPCWTRTVRGHLWDRRKELTHLYQLFDLFKENSRVLAEGNPWYFETYRRLKTLVLPLTSGLSLPRPSKFSFGKDGLYLPLKMRTRK